MSESNLPESPETPANHADADSTRVATAAWKQRREAKGLSLEDLFGLTHIAIRKLEAIEKGDFAELGSQTFAAGYIRNYAKILGENPDDYLAVYYKSIGGAPDPSASIMPSPDERALLSPSFKKKLPILPISVGVIVVWVLVMIFTSDDDEASETRPNSGAMSDSDALSQSVRLTPTPTKMEDLIITATPLPRESLSTLSLSGAESNQSADVEDASQAQTPVEVTAAAPVSPSDAEEVQASQAATQAGEGDDTLVFTFSDDCWLEVLDGEGQVLIAQLKRKGDNLRLFGQGPFQVMMGNARAVTLTINGETVSTQPLGGNKTRKMTVNSPN